MSECTIFDIETFAENEDDVMEEYWNSKTKQLEKRYKPNPIKERITCISVMDTKQQQMISFCEEDEKNILEKFWKYAEHNKMIYGWNSDTFDFVFIKLRSFINNVAMVDCHFQDLRAILYEYLRSNENRFLKGKLTDFAELMGKPAVTDNGSTMRAKWLAKDYEGIRKHCEEDCLLTFEIWKRMINLNMSL